MTDPVMRKIQDILSKTNGQPKLAEQAVRVLIERDHKFLLGLVEPYLGGIIAHAIDRVRKQGPVKQAQTPAKTAAKPVAKTPKTKAEALESVGSIDTLLKAWSRKFDTPETKKPLADRVSPSHVEAMNALIKKKK
jgi:hypothetical protein